LIDNCNARCLNYYKKNWGKTPLKISGTQIDCLLVLAVALSVMPDIIIFRRKIGGKKPKKHLAVLNQLLACLCAHAHTTFRSTIFLL
jgi:hypothetical protein